MVSPFFLLRAGGFSYIALLITIAIISLTATATVQLGSIVQRRQSEDQLLFVGLQYKHAIRSYMAATPPGRPAEGPSRLEDLLRDPRYPNIKRHIRQLYPDPITGKTDWVLIRNPNGNTLFGVHSRSQEPPIRLDNFPEQLFYLKGKRHYSDWLFVDGVSCSEQACEIDGRDNSAKNAKGPF